MYFQTIAIFFLLSSMAANGFMVEKSSLRMPIPSNNFARMIDHEIKHGDAYRHTLFEQLCSEIRNRNQEVQRNKQLEKETQIYKKYLAERNSVSQFLKDFHTSRY